MIPYTNTKLLRKRFDIKVTLLDCLAVCPFIRKSVRPSVGLSILLSFNKSAPATIVSTHGGAVKL